MIPEGDWFCPTCQHSQLIEQLETKLTEFDVNFKELQILEEKQKTERDARNEAAEKELEYQKVRCLEKCLVWHFSSWGNFVFINISACEIAGIRNYHFIEG